MITNPVNAVNADSLNAEFDRLEASLTPGQRSVADFLMEASKDPEFVLVVLETFLSGGIAAMDDARIEQAQKFSEELATEFNAITDRKIAEGTPLQVGSVVLAVAALASSIITQALNIYHEGDTPEQAI